MGKSPNGHRRGVESMKAHNDGFVPAGEVTVDDRARIAIGKMGVRRNDRYAVAVNDEGEILLTPVVTITKRELLVWENQYIRQLVGEGLQQSAAGEVSYLGDLSEHLADED